MKTDDLNEPAKTETQWRMDDDDPADPRLAGVDIDAPVGFVPCELRCGVLAPEVP
jgi:hypothetical protein